MRFLTTAVLLGLAAGCSTAGPDDPSSEAALSSASDPTDGIQRDASCTRPALARTAPVALFDTFRAEALALTGDARRQRTARFFADVAAQGGAPLEDPESGRVVFLARGGGSWRVAGSFVGWDAARAVPFEPLPETDLWAAEANIPRGSSFEYKLLAGSAFREDPLAKNVVWDGIDRGFGARGELNAVGHPGDAPLNRGRMVSLGKVHAQRLNDDRDVWVHFPAAYDDGSCRKLPSVMIHDGLESLTRGGFAQEADRLYAARPDLAAVLVFVGLPTQEVRFAQYTFASDGARGPDYVDFLANDLWPLMNREARLCQSPAARGISGASLGGLISTFAGFERPDQWGWIGGQSSSFFWADNAMIRWAESVPRKPLRIYLDSGCPDDNCVVTNQMASALASKGYDHVRVTKPGGTHDWWQWRDRLGGMLAHFRNGQTACD